MWATFTYVVETFFSKPHHLLLLSCCIAGGLWVKRCPPAFRLIILYLWFALFIEVGSLVLKLVYRNNMPFLHLYTLGTFLIWSYIYKYVLGEGFRKYFYLIIATGSIAIVANTYWIQPLFSFNTYSITGIQLILIWYSIAYAFKVPDHVPDAEDKAFRWINAGVLIYYAGSLFIFMTGFLIPYGGKPFMVNINKGLVSVFYIIMIIGLWKVHYKVPRSTCSSASPS